MLCVGALLGLELALQVLDGVSPGDSGRSGAAADAAVVAIGQRSDARGTNHAVLFDAVDLRADVADAVAVLGELGEARDPHGGERGRGVIGSRT